MRTSRPGALRAALAAMLLAVIGLSGVALLVAAPASAARTLTILITADGPKPAALTAAIGDTIVFKNDDMTFIHQARSASPNWSFNTGPLAPGARATAGTLKKPGTYLYEGANLDDFTGKVVIPAATSPSSPAPAASASPSSAGEVTPSPAASSASPSPSATGGSGSASAPSIGGFGPGGLPLPSATPGGPAPDVAPVVPGAPTSAAAETPGITASPGRLPAASTARAYGLPVALATVAAVGVASLILRLLLAQPRRRTA